MPVENHQTAIEADARRAVEEVAHLLRIDRLAEGIGQHHVRAVQMGQRGGCRIAHGADHQLRPDGEHEDAEEGEEYDPLHVHCGWQGYDECAENGIARTVCR